MSKKRAIERITVTVFIASPLAIGAFLLGGGIRIVFTMFVVWYLCEGIERNLLKLKRYKND